MQRYAIFFILQIFFKKLKKNLPSVTNIFCVSRLEGREAGAKHGAKRTP